MTTTVNQARSTGPWTREGKSVVVGVDGSARSRAAVAWAVDQATATGRPLDLVAVLSPRMLEGSHTVARAIEDGDWQVLNDIAAGIAVEHPAMTVRKTLSVGGSAPCLIARAAEQALLVVGKRGVGTFVRLMVGSTSLEVAGESPVPVVVVPDTWQQDEHATQPVVVGVNPFEPHEDALAVAFTEARRRGVELVAVHGFEVPAMLSWDPVAMPPSTYDDLATNASEQLTVALAPYRDAYADVTVRVEFHHGNPADFLLQQSHDAQLVVLGRKHGHFGGFTWGSVARAVLHYAEVPVVIVPEPRRLS